MGKFLLAGLGNPGGQYKGTRHNLGFILADLLGENFRSPVSFPFSFCETEEFTLIKPKTFMNKSGLAVERAAAYFNFSQKEIMVACDDFNLPLGKLRLRGRGSAGGHNGLQSVIDYLGTSDFPRIRMGIGGQYESDKVSYVLGRFHKSEAAKVRDMLIDAGRLIRYFCKHGLEETMNKFN